MLAYNATMNIKKQHLSDNDFKLAKFFISSNTALVQLENPNLKDILAFKVPCRQTLTSTVLPSIFESVKSIINAKLQAAENISLISDIWTNTKMHDFH